MLVDFVFHFSNHLCATCCWHCSCSWSHLYFANLCASILPIARQVLHDLSRLQDRLVVIWCFRAVFCGPGIWLNFITQYKEFRARSWWQDVKARSLDSTAVIASLQSMRLGSATAQSRVAMWGALAALLIASNCFLVSMRNM